MFAMSELDFDELDKQELKKKYQKQNLSDTKELKPKGDIKVWKFLIWILAIPLFLFVLLIIIDKAVIPAFVHNRSLVETPNVIGMPVKEAVDVLYGVGLQFIVSTKDADEDQLVVKQIPRQGAIVKEGRTVYLSLSKTLPRVRMPKIIGKTLDRARPFLVRQNLYFGVITYDYHDSIGVDTIISQSIAPYKLIPEESSIDVVISKGLKEQAIVPNLYLLSLEEAKEHIQRAELKIGNITYISEKTFLPNTVIVQSPSAGDIVPRHSTSIDITVTK